MTSIIASNSGKLRRRSPTMTSHQRLPESMTSGMRSMMSSKSPPLERLLLIGSNLRGTWSGAETPPPHRCPFSSSCNTLHAFSNLRSAYSRVSNCRLGQLGVREVNDRHTAWCPKIVWKGVDCDLANILPKNLGDQCLWLITTLTPWWNLTKHRLVHVSRVRVRHIVRADQDQRSRYNMILRDEKFDSCIEQEGCSYNQCCNKYLNYNI